MSTEWNRSPSSSRAKPAIDMAYLYIITPYEPSTCYSHFLLQPLAPATATPCRFASQLLVLSRSLKPGKNPRVHAYVRAWRDQGPRTSTTM